MQSVLRQAVFKRVITLNPQAHVVAMVAPIRAMVLPVRAMEPFLHQVVEDESFDEVSVSTSNVDEYGLPHVHDG